MNWSILFFDNRQKTVRIYYGVYFLLIIRSIYAVNVETGTSIWPLKAISALDKYLSLGFGTEQHATSHFIACVNYIQSMFSSRTINMFGFNVSTLTRLSITRSISSSPPFTYLNRSFHTSNVNLVTSNVKGFAYNTFLKGQYMLLRGKR